MVCTGTWNWALQPICAQAAIEYYLLRHTPADTPHMTREMIGQCSTTKPAFSLCVLINLISISKTTISTCKSI